MRTRLSSGGTKCLRSRGKYVRHGHTHNALEYDKAARAMVAEMYKTYQYGHVDGMLHEQQGNRYCHSQAALRGLIPSPEIDPNGPYAMGPGH